MRQKALSAVSLAGQVTFFLDLCISVLVQGTTVLAASSLFANSDSVFLTNVKISSARFRSKIPSSVRVVFRLLRIRSCLRLELILIMASYSDIMT